MSRMDFNEFEKAFKFLANVCSKQIPKDDMIKFFWNRVQTLDEASIRAAFAFFAADSHWPTANEFCLQCGSGSGSHKAIGEFERGEARHDDFCYRLLCTRKGSTLDAQESELRNSVEIHAARGDYYAVREIDGAKRDTWERQIFGTPKAQEQPKQETKFKLPSTDYKAQAAGDFT